ncbi:hypothetical protein AB7M49_000048 [Bradyrhizobium elkanii]
MAGTKSRPFLLSCVGRRQHAATVARNTLFTIFVDLSFTTFVRRAFTKARNATCERCAIA